MGHSAIYILIHFYDSAMKWIWSIGNKINDGHKALAVLTLNNLSFDASLLLLHDAPSVFTTLCSNSWGVKRKWQPSFLLSLYIQHKDFKLTPHIFCVTCMCYSWRETGWPQSCTKGCFVQLGRWRHSANHGSLPCSSMKRSWKLHFAVASTFPNFFFARFWNDARMCKLERTFGI